LNSHTVPKGYKGNYFISLKILHCDNCINVTVSDFDMILVFNPFTYAAKFCNSEESDKL
jgi:hypothetical protein